VSVVVSSERFGEVSVVMVGATIVGRITTTALDGPRTPLGEHTITPPKAVSRGDEVGTFHLGSTVVLLVPPGPSQQKRISYAAGPVRLGESLERSHG